MKQFVLAYIYLNVCIFDSFLVYSIRQCFYRCWFDVAFIIKTDRQETVVI